jgi:hypothetical protein
MTRIQLYESAVLVGKSLTGETDNIKIASAIVAAAEDQKVSGDDFPQYQQYVMSTRNNYNAMSTQKLPSEQAAARAAQIAAQKTPAPAVAPAVE